MCADHPDYPMELYCHRCAACVCLRCHYSGAHKGHDTTPLLDIHGALAADLTANAQHLGATEHIVANVVEQLQAASAEVAAGAAAARESVQTAFAAAQAVLDAAKDDVNRRLAEWESSRRSAVTADLAEARATQLTLALAAVGLRAALVDSSTQAVTQLLERREALGKRAKAIARVSAFAEGALAALRADAKDPNAGGAAAGQRQRQRRRPRSWSGAGRSWRTRVSAAFGFSGTLSWATWIPSSPHCAAPQTRRSRVCKRTAARRHCCTGATPPTLGWRSASLADHPPHRRAALSKPRS
jgi:hypothetical protein